MRVRLDFREKWAVPEGDSWYEIWQCGLALNQMFSIVALCLSLPFLTLRLKPPRPALRRIFRQPGMAACTAVVAYSLLLVISSVVYQLRGLVIGNEALNIFDMVSMLECVPLGGAVAGAWIALWLTRTMCPEPSWIDRSGRALGTYWITSSVLSPLPDFLG
jgi:hypothetical protein